MDTATNMRAVAYDGYGAIERLDIREVPDPVLRRDDILVYTI